MGTAVWAVSGKSLNQACPRCSEGVSKVCLDNRILSFVTGHTFDTPYRRMLGFPSSHLLLCQ